MEKKLRIGVMTYWWSQDNYGQLLQAYALQEYLRQLGHEPFLIRYLPHSDYLKFSKTERIIHYLDLKNLWNRFVRLIEPKRSSLIVDKKFDDFRRERLILSEKEYNGFHALLDEPPEADVYISGSDQVWNFGRMPLRTVQNVMNAYMLSFGDTSIKRISFAASIGSEKFYKKHQDYLGRELKKFNLITLRELDSCHYLNNLLGDQVKLFPDPTMLHEEVFYRKLFLDIETKFAENNYVFIYMVGNDGWAEAQSVINYCNNNQIPYFYCGANKNRDNNINFHPKIEEWLCSMSHAKCVVTNSYHCVIFSAIFRKRCSLVRRKTSGKGMNNRFETLNISLKNGVNLFSSKKVSKIFEQSPSSFDNSEFVAEAKVLLSGILSNGNL